MQTSIEFGQGGQEHVPLAARMRPQSLSDYVGQSHLLGKGKPLRMAIEGNNLHSMILWGPPGSGKTTVAHLLAVSGHTRFVILSAVLAGVKEVRQAMNEAAQTLLADGTQTILFIDEIHRFNKAQQDAFLPFVENGTVILVGATTENPSFTLNNALLSRARTYVLKRLDDAALRRLLHQTLTDCHRGLGTRTLKLSAESETMLIGAADGDARRLLSMLELAVDMIPDMTPGQEIVPSLVKKVIAGGVRQFDRQGDAFYDQISALHKSVRGSNPDAALYWLARMLDGGCDPLYIVRRLVRMASEDIGNADPRALQMALEAWQAQERLGSPEGHLSIAQAVVFLACAAKSNAVYTAFKAAQGDVKQYGSLPVPLSLRNAPTQLMQELGHGEDYRYAHDEADAFAAGAEYFPEDMSAQTYYHPVPRGLEIKLAEKLAALRARDVNSQNG